MSSPVWTAYYLLDEEIDADAALDAPGVPDELRDPAGADEEQRMYDLLRWASPLLPAGDPDPYELRLTAAQVAVIAA